MRLQLRYKFFVDTSDHHRRIFAKVNSSRNAILFAFRVRRLPSTSHYAIGLPPRHIRGFHRCEKLSERTKRLQNFHSVCKSDYEMSISFLSTSIFLSFCEPKNNSQSIRTRHPAPGEIVCDKTATHAHSRRCDWLRRSAHSTKNKMHFKLRSRYSTRLDAAF